jgi:hypothetical protein
LLGDFNSNYNEFIDFANNKKLNNTYGITGINHILNTVIENKFILQSTMRLFDKQVLYNLWLELQKNERYSTIFGNKKDTPDNILLPIGLFDNQNISYKDNSFRVFNPKYLYRNKRIFRWAKTKGYSDHLPIMATFTTQKFKLLKSQKQIKKILNLKDLYACEDLVDNLRLKNIVVIYKNKNNAILKQPNGRAIYAYHCAKKLKLGYMYDLTLDNIVVYNGLLEVKRISNIIKKKKIINYKKFFYDGTKIDILDPKYTNEIVTGFEVTYKKRYLYLANNRRIRLFIAKRFIKLKQNGKYLIKSGHLSIYKGQTQITIYKKSDLMRIYI